MTCATCRYFFPNHKEMAENHEAGGLCLRYPRRAVTNPYRNRIEYLFPAHRKDDWCGEYTQADFEESQKRRREP